MTTILLNWNILGCIAKEYGKQREKLDLDCTTPWSQSAIGNHDYSDDKPCNDTQFNKELAFSVKLFTDAANNQFRKCLSKNTFFSNNK